MKKTVVFILSIVLLVGCAKEKSIEERYLYEGDKIVDVETGDQYIIDENPENITIIHEDGSVEKIAIDEAPFYGSGLSDELINDWKKSLKEREELLLEEKRNKLKAERKARYAEMSDRELLDKFQTLHRNGESMAIQMDIVAELVDRGAISSEDAPDLLEIEPDMVDFDIEIDNSDQ